MLFVEAGALQEGSAVGSLMIILVGTSGQTAQCMFAQAKLLSMCFVKDQQISGEQAL